MERLFCPHYICIDYSDQILRSLFRHICHFWLFWRTCSSQHSSPHGQMRSFSHLSLESEMAKFKCALRKAILAGPLWWMWERVAFDSRTPPSDALPIDHSTRKLYSSHFLLISSNVWQWYGNNVTSCKWTRMHNNNDHNKNTFGYLSLATRKV